MIDRIRACALALALCVPSAPRADTFPEGFLGTTVPRPLGQLATLSNGTFVAFDGARVTLHSESGSLLFTLATLVDTDFPSFVRVDPAETFVVVGESLNGGLWRVPLDPFGPGGGSASLVATLQFNYDASFLDADTLYVSAAHDQALDNEIYRVELSPPGFQQVASLPGFSGPLQVVAGGDLVYATSEFPVPPSGARVLRFGAAQLASGVVLTEADASLVGAGFSGAASFAYDPLQDELYLAASDFVSGNNALLRVQGDAADSPALAAGEPGDFLANLEFLPASDARAQLRAFQPDTGGRLRYSGLAQRTELAGLRPQAFLSGPGLSGAGAFAVHLADAPAAGSAYVLYAGGGPLTSELALFLPGQGLSVFLGLDPFGLEFDPAPLALDGNGSGSRGYVNPGGLNGVVWLQVLALRPDGSIAGTSEVVAL